MGNCGARVRVSLRLRPVSRVCPGAAAAPALSSSCPRWPGVGPGPRPRAIGLSPGRARPAELREAALCAGAEAGAALPSPQRQERKFAAAPRGGPLWVPRPRPGLDRGRTSGRRQGRAGLGRPRQGRGSRRRACGAAPQLALRAPGWKLEPLPPDPRPPPPPVALSGLGRREMGAVSAQGPQGRAPRLGGGGRPARSGLLGLPLSGPLQGQPASLGGFRLLPEGSGPGVHHGWGSVADRGLPLGRGSGAPGSPPACCEIQSAVGEGG